MRTSSEGEAHREETSQASEQARPSSQPPLVLIVEDEPSIATMIEALLRDEGYRTMRAETGQAAEEMTRRYHPDLVLLDLYLPDKNGVDVFRELKADPETAEIPIVVQSAYTQIFAPEEVLRLIEVVPKPFDVDRLLETIKRVLEGARRG